MARKLPWDPVLSSLQCSDIRAGSQYRPCNEETNFRPDNPYAASKLFAHMAAVGYRENYGLFAVNGILLNHESPLRPPPRVQENLIWSRQDQPWCDRGIEAGQPPRGSRLGIRRRFRRRDVASLQAEGPTDYVFSTGEAHSVWDFVRAAFEVVGLDWRDHVVQVDSLQRASEPEALIGDSSRARTELGWRPLTSFEQLSELMLRCDLNETKTRTGKGFE